MGEREPRDAAVTARSTNVVHYTKRTLDAAAKLIAGLADRSAAVATEGNVGFLAVTATPDDALSLAESVLQLRQGSTRPLMPITSPARGRRLIAVGSGVLAGSAAHLARLVADSRLALTELHTLVLVWPEDVIADDEQRTALESILAEVPRSAERIAVSASRSPELAQFFERSMWRAREIDHTTAVATADIALRVFTAVASEQMSAIRSVLDTFDPRSTVLLAFSDETEAAARRAAALFDVENALLQVHRSIPSERASLAIILDDVPSAEVLIAAAGMFDELVAIVRPENLAALREVAPAMTPVAWTGALANARTVQDLLRDEVRSYAGSGAHLPWIPIVEPLLDGLDAVEVAATALALLDRERRKAKKVAPAVPMPATPVRSAREESGRPDPRRDRDREGRGFPKKRPWAGASRDQGDDRRRERPRDRDERRRPDDRERGPRRGGDIDRVPRAARESREWTERSERLRNSRRGPRGGGAG